MKFFCKESKSEIISFLGEVELGVGGGGGGWSDFFFYFESKFKINKIFFGGGWGGGMRGEGDRVS